MPNDPQDAADLRLRLADEIHAARELTHTSRRLTEQAARVIRRARVLRGAPAAVVIHPAE